MDIGLDGMDRKLVKSIGDFEALIELLREDLRGKDVNL